MPVALAFGRPRLPTMPHLTGSSPTPNTIGIIEVTAMAARTADGGVPGVAMTATAWRAKSVVTSGMRSYRPLSQ